MFQWVCLNRSRYYAKALGIIKKWCHIRKEKMNGNNFVLEINFATTDMNDFMNQLTQVTNGDYQFENDDQCMFFHLERMNNIVSASYYTAEGNKLQMTILQPSVHCCFMWFFFH